ncbi:MAG: leucyl aminopeptidase, partial [Thiomicrorhabdus sp.]|nr:leucyl aminopeptidase [Thiomicrorhabdus sp.]
MKHIQFTFNTHLNDIDTLILPVNDQGELHSNVQDLPDQTALSELVQQLHQSSDFSGKLASTLLLIQPANLTTQRVLLVGMGEAEKLTVKGYLSALNSAASALDHSGATHVLNALILSPPPQHDLTWAICHNTQALQHSFYDYSHESRGEDHSPKEPKLEQISYPCESTDERTQAVAQGQASAIGMALTQELANMPSNFCTPAFLAETAIELGNDYGYEVNILDREEMIKMGMGSFMSVAQGGDTPPKMICLSYKGGEKNQAPIALVGKGVTFDTGGISLKPGAAMDEMKYDMGGAATVLGVFKALGELKPNINVVGVIPATENMPSGNAIKPGDVVTSLSGQ